MDKMYHASQLMPPTQTAQAPPRPPATGSPPIKCELGFGGGGGGGADSASASPQGAIANMERDKDRATYLQQLIKDQKCCLSYPNVFHHVERLLSEGTDQRTARLKVAAPKTTFKKPKWVPRETITHGHTKRLLE